MSETQLLHEIKDGVAGVLEKQGEFDARLNALEGSGLAARKIKALGGHVSCESREEFSFGKALKICVLTANNQLNNDKDLLNSKEFKVMSEATVLQKSQDVGTSGAGGGYIIPQQYVAVLIELLRAKLTVVQAGATLMEGLTGSPVIVPKQLTGATLQWIGQNTTITTSDQSWDQVQMTPKTAAMRVQISNLLGILSNPKMEGLIKRDLAKIMALGLDLAALRGSGVSNQPLGLKGVSGLGTYAIGTNGGDATRQDLLKMVGVVEDQDAADGKLAFITHPKIKRVLKNERIAQFSGQTTGQYVQYPLSDKKLAESLDYPVLSTSQLPVNLTKGSSTDCSEIYFGNWEELLIGTWGGLEILATNIGGNAWAQNAIEIRLIQNVDVQVRHGQSFVLCSDARIVNA